MTNQIPIVIEGPYDLSKIDDLSKSPVSFVVVKGYETIPRMANDIDLFFADQANFWNVQTTFSQGIPVRTDLEFGVFHTDLDRLETRAREALGYDPFEIIPRRDVAAILTGDPAILSRPDLRGARIFQTDPSVDVYKEATRMSPWGWGAALQNDSRAIWHVDAETRRAYAAHMNEKLKVMAPNPGYAFQ